MSDAPLFQNTDAQEEVFAPQQLPAGQAERAGVDVEGGNRSGSDADNGAIPVGGVAMAGQAGAGGSSTIAGGSAGAAGPVVGAAALASEANDDTPGRRGA